MTFIIVEENNAKIWGIFTDTTQLASTYLNILELNPSKILIVKEYISNTNIVKCSYKTKKEILNLCKLQWLDKSEDKKENDSVESIDYPRAIKREVDKIIEKYNIFSENLKTFYRLLENKVFTLDDEIEKIPILFQDKFEIYKDIVLLKVPDNEAFEYFIDRFTPNNDD